MRQAIWVTAAVFIAAIAVPAASRSLRQTGSARGFVRRGSTRLLTDIQTISGEGGASPYSPSRRRHSVAANGKGVISCRHGADWSAPAFMILRRSIGFQTAARRWIRAARHEPRNEPSAPDKVALGGEGRWLADRWAAMRGR